MHKLKNKSDDWKRGYIAGKRDIYEILRMHRMEGIIDVIEEKIKRSKKWGLQ